MGWGLVVFRHGKDRNLRDRAGLPLDSSRSLVQGGKIRIEVTGIPPAFRVSLCVDADTSRKRFTIVRHIREDDEDVHPEVESEILRSRQGQPGGDDALDRGVVG